MLILGVGFGKACVSLDLWQGSLWCVKLGEELLVISGVITGQT